MTHIKRSATYTCTSSLPLLFEKKVLYRAALLVLDTNLSWIVYSGRWLYYTANMHAEMLGSDDPLISLVKADISATCASTTLYQRRKR